MKKGILMVSFGSSYKGTRHKNIDKIKESLRSSYQGIPCYSAFTSDVIRRILEERDGIVIMDVEQALLKMKQDGITHVYLQPTHIIDGIENHKAKAIANRLEPEFEQLVMARPLIGTENDYTEVVQGIWKELGETVSDKLLILMGHGSEHAANHSYKRLEQAFRKAGHENVFLATVEAKPSLEDVLEIIRENPCKRVLLTPFMLVAGEHAISDMAGEKDSFLSKLIEQGYEVEVLLKGLGEYEAIRSLFLSHLQEIYENKDLQKETVPKGILYGVGVGPGDPELMTLKAVRQIKECDMIGIPAAEKEKCTAYQIVKQVIPQIEEKPCLEIAMPMTKNAKELEEAHRMGAERIKEQLAAGNTLAFLTLGDPTVYSTFSYLQEIIKEEGYRTEMISGVTSFCASAARLGISLGEKEEAIHIIPASYGTEEALLLEGTKVLMKSGKKLGEIKKRLQEENNVSIYEVQNCGMQGERVAYGVEELSEENSYYTTLMVKDSRIDYKKQTRKGSK